MKLGRTIYRERFVEPLLVALMLFQIATGAPAGLIHDAWNIRLVPHYWLGAFFALSHLASGLRGVLDGHRVDPAVTLRIWQIGLLVSAVVASLILAGMCGLRL